MTQSNPPQPQPNQNFSSASFVVGIGASAGGLQALEAFFSSLLPEPGAAFVVVQHLSPDFRSLMVELLQRRTRLPVYLIENGMAININSVYVLPPGFIVRLQGQQLYLEERQGGQLDYPVDYFFLSLAQERGDRCISILLSGTGHDGTEGLKAISRAGGVALVQSQETTQFGAMPSSPLSSGLVDEILSPEELAQAVCDIIRYSYTQASLTQNSTNLLPTDQLNQILDILQRQENIDFSLYKPGTLNRRIIHRLLLSKVNTISQYINYLNESVEEVKNLRQDLLIGATRFFRDPEMWSLLQTQVLPSLLENLQPGNPLRLWVTGCSTGEEAYSLAIAIDEVMRDMEEKHPVKLFATDIDQEALAIASQGIYSDNIAQDIGRERLESYFVAEGSTYRIKKSIRSQVVFASHDLTKNPGFSQMHLVSCRNLLIYMQPALQEQVLMLLHFSLAKKGILILGPSENLGVIPHAFDVINQQWKIFRKRLDVQLPVSRIIKSPTMQSVTEKMGLKPRPSRATF
ncbi:CheR family methyltransferase [Hydrocoleum sp. CS-953]|uniref:CheR family methyltransferase n=1 Tax=Hydrocoleum sp. CS-953 TaxID=1671698 RepID=UPI000B9B70CB|nr:CheR family methyltransferase [Hydrocoleum sp. CS-953]